MTVRSCKLLLLAAFTAILFVPNTLIGQPSDFSQAYKRAESAVVQVQAGLSRGTGFLVSPDYLIVTNDHVISGSEDVSVILPQPDSGVATRVRATVAASNRDRDLAVLRINPDQCRGCQPLPLAEELPKPGTRVAAMGFPLSQPLTITSGIVAAIREGAIISDVTLNSGNSGGPLLSLDGRVVGVNTFRSGQSGEATNISGSLLVSQLKPLLKQAREAPLPEADTLPVVSSEVYRVSYLRKAASSVDTSAYEEAMSARSGGGFQIRVSTPVSPFVEARGIGAKREKREQKERMVPVERLFSSRASYRSWERFVGNRTSPLIAIEVIPKVSETTGSIFERAFSEALVGVQGQAELEFEGDVGSVRLFRNGKLVLPVVGGIHFNEAFIDNPAISLTDVVGQGYYAYRPEIFRPDSTGTPPSIVIWVTDLMTEGEMSLATRFELPPEIVARAWNDFEQFYSAVEPDQPFIRAKPELFQSWCDHRDRWPSSWPLSMESGPCQKL